MIGLATAEVVRLELEVDGGKGVWAGVGTPLLCGGMYALLVRMWRLGWCGWVVLSKMGCWGARVLMGGVGQAPAMCCAGVCLRGEPMGGCGKAEAVSLPQDRIS